MKKNRKESWDRPRIIQWMLLIFGGVVLALCLAVSLASQEPPFTQGQVTGILIATMGFLEAGMILKVVRLLRAKKDPFFAIGGCIGILLVLLWQLL